MPTGYTRQSAADIVTGNTINAAPLNNEFNQVQAAMDATTGHNHDGTAGGGAPISLTTSVAGLLPVAHGGTGASTASAARAGLGLAIGTDVQAYDPGLQSIAGLTTAANKMIYTTSSDVYAVADLTAAGRALLDDADATAQRATLGLGSIATQNANSVSISGGTVAGVTITGGTVSSTITGSSVSATTLSVSGDVTITDKIIHSGDTDTAIRFPSSDTVTVETGGTERLRVTNTSISTTSPVSVQNATGGAKIDLSNTAITNAIVNQPFNELSFLSASDDAAWKSSVRGYVGGFSDQVGLSFYTYSVSTYAESMRITSVGSIHFPRVGTTASAANAFLDSGASPSNQLLRSTSSLRYKTGVEDVTLAEAQSVFSLRPIKYQSLAEADDKHRVWYGLIAEEVSGVDQRLVHYMDGAPDGVQYERIIVPLLKIVKDLSQRVAALEAQNG